MTPEKDLKYQTSSVSMEAVPSYISGFNEHARKLHAEGKVVEEKAAFSVSVGDNEQLNFVIDEHDEGVAILGGTENGSVLDHPLLQDATPAMIYHGVTTSGEEVPDVLLRHHESVVRQFDRRLADGALEPRRRGWLLADLPTVYATSACDNAAFRKNICAHHLYDESLCKIDTTGTWTWSVPGAYRYKAGVCLQTGQAISYLSYEHVRHNEALGGCESCRTLHVGWGLESLLFDTKFSAGTYKNYVHWKTPSTQWGRNYTHVIVLDPGSVANWGQRYSWKPCSQFT